MFLILLLAALVVGLIVIGGVFIFLKKKNGQPLTPESIPPIPSVQEANTHFTPVSAPIAPLKKPAVNKKLLIAIAVVFNIILIGTVIYIGQSITKPKNVAVNKPLPSITPQAVLPTAVPNNSLNSPQNVTPTCSPMPACVASKQCDIATPAGGWCPVPTLPKSATSSSLLSQLPPTSVPTITKVIAQIVSSPTPTLTPIPTTIIVAAISPTLAPTTAAELTTAPAVLPETGVPFSLLALIIPAFFVAIAFVL